jgi:hypothetical protein
MCPRSVLLWFVNVAGARSTNIWGRKEHRKLFFENLMKEAIWKTGWSLENVRIDLKQRGAWDV